MFEVIRFNVYCYLLQEWLKETNEVKRADLVEDLEVLKSGFIPMKYLHGGKK